MRYFGEMAKFLKSNQQCMFLGRWQFGDMAIWGDGNLGRWVNTRGGSRSEIERGRPRGIISYLIFAFTVLQPL